MSKEQYYYLDIIVYPIIGFVFMVFHMAMYGLSLWMPIFMVVGFVCWTLFEYGIHRLTHVTGNIDHIRHHQKPLEFSGPFLHQSLVLFFVVYLVVFMLTSRQIATAWFPGFIWGYCVYFARHALIHFGLDGESPSGLDEAAEHHLLHHKDSDVNFGVTTEMWDVIFMTKGEG